MTKIFVTGGAGFVGSFVTKQLLKQGDKVVIHDAFLNYISPFKSNYQKLLKLRFEDEIDKVEIIRGDIRHREELLKILKKIKPEKIVHLAALPIAPVANKLFDDAMSINRDGTMNVLECARQIPTVNHFIYASSSMVYGDFRYTPADENHPTNPNDVYGGTKLSGEILTRVYHKQYGINYNIIRLSSVYGPTDVNRRVSQIFIENALKGKPLVLHDGGESKLDFTYVEDVAQGFVLALKKDKALNEVFNITRGEARSLKEFAEILKTLIPNIKVETKELSKKEKRPERGTLDISKARKLLGYNPKYSLEDGLKKYVEFVKKHGMSSNNG